MKETIILIISVLALILWFFVAQEFQRIAAMKGHNESRYFWWTFLVAPAGMLMVIALPNNVNKLEIHQAVGEDLPEI